MKNLNNNFFLFYNNFYKYNNICYNFNFLFFFYYKYKKNKNIFIKTNNNKLKNFKKKSFYRDKNLFILQKYFNNSVYNGKKESFFKKFNIFLKLFYDVIINKNNYFNNYINYINTINFLNINKLNYDFNFFIKEFIYEYDSIFNIKIIKIPKKYVIKFKKKFDFELQYIFKEKRLKYTLKLINNSVKKNKNYNLENKFFWVFINIIFDPKNCFLWNRKINIYNRAMKKFYKKKII